MKLKKLTALAVLTAMLSSNIASSVMPITVYATETEAASEEASVEETQAAETETAEADTASVAEESVSVESVEETEAAAETEEPAQEEVQETEAEVSEPEADKADSGTDDSSAQASTTETAGSGESESAAFSDAQNSSESTTEAASETTSEAADTASTSDAADTASTKDAAAEENSDAAETGSTESAEEGKTEEEETGEQTGESDGEEEEKSYTLSYDSICDGTSIGSGEVSVTISGENVSLDGEPSYEGYSLDWTEIAGHKLDGGKLADTDDPASAISDSSTVTFHFHTSEESTAEEAVTIHVTIQYQDQDGNTFQDSNTREITLKKDETKTAEPDEKTIVQYTDSETITYTYDHTKIGEEIRSEVTAADDGRIVTFVYQKEAETKTVKVTVHEIAVDTEGSTIQDLGDTIVEVKKGEEAELSAPGADSLPHADNVTYTYKTTKVDGTETGSVNGDSTEVTAEYVYEKTTAVSLKQEAVDTDGNVIQELGDLKAELKGSDAVKPEAPDAKQFDTEDEEEKVTYQYQKTTVGGKDAEEVTAEDDGKTIQYVYEKTVEKKITKLTLHQEAVTTDGKVIRKLDDLKLTLKKDETKDLADLDAPKEEDLEKDEDDTVTTYTLKKVQISDSRDAKAITDKDDGKTIQFVYEAEKIEKIQKTVHIEAVDDTDDHAVIKEMADQKLTFKGEDDEITLAKIQPDTSAFTKKDKTYTYEYTYQYAMLDGEKTAKVSADDLTEDSTITFVYKVRKTEIPVTRTVQVVIRDTDDRVIRKLDEIEVTFNTSRTRLYPRAFIKYAADVKELKEDETYEYTYDSTLLNGKEFTSLTSKDLADDDVITLVYEKKPIAHEITLKVVDGDGKAIRGYEKKTLPEKDRLDLSKALYEIDGYTYKSAEIGDTVVTAMESEDDVWVSYTDEDGKTQKIKKDLTLTLIYEKQDRKEIQVTATSVDEDGKTIEGHEKEDLPGFDGTLKLDDPEKAPIEIEGYDYVGAKIDDTVITALKKTEAKEDDSKAEDEEESDAKEEKDEADEAEYVWSYAADGKTVEITEDTNITLSYEKQPERKATKLTVTYVDEFGDPIGDEYQDLEIEDEKFDEDGVLKLEAGEDKALPEKIQIAQDDSSRKIIQYEYDDSFVLVDTKKTKITAIRRTEIQDKDTEENKESKEETKEESGKKYAYEVRYEGSDEYTDLTEDTTVYIQYNGGRKRLYTYEDDSVKVTAILQHAYAVPDDAEFVVTPITKDSSDYNYDAYMEALNENADKLTDKASAETTEDTFTEENTLLYDIAFMGHPAKEDGTIDEDKTIEYQPAEGYVNICVQFRKDQLSEDLGAAEDEDVTIVHLPLKDDVKEAADTTRDAKEISASDIEVEKIDSDVNTDSETANFNADNFSAFVFVNNVDLSQYCWNYKDGQGIDYSYEQLLSMVNAQDNTTNFAIYANRIEQNGHLEGNVKAGYLNVHDRSGQLNQESNVIIRNRVKEVVVTKTLDAPLEENAAFNFASYTGNEQIETFSITIPAGKTKAQYTLDENSETVKKLSPSSDTSKNSADVIIYELDKNGNPVAENGQNGKYTVNYTNSEITSINSTSNYNNYIGTIENSTNDKLFNHYFYGDQGSYPVTYIENMTEGKFLENSNDYQFTSNGNTIVIQDYKNVDSELKYLKQQNGITAETKSNLDYLKSVSMDLANAHMGAKIGSGSLSVVNVISTTGDLQSDLNKVLNQVQNGTSITGTVNEGGYLLINVDASKYDTYQLNQIVIDGANADNNNEVLGRHVIINIVKKDGDSFVPYDGLVNVNNVSQGLVLIPAATFSQSGGLRGEIVANKVDRTASGSETHKDTLTTDTIQYVHVSNSSKLEFPGVSCNYTP